MQFNMYFCFRHMSLFYFHSSLLSFMFKWPHKRSVKQKILTSVDHLVNTFFCTVGIVSARYTLVYQRTFVFFILCLIVYYVSVYVCWMTVTLSYRVNFQSKMSYRVKFQKSDIKGSDAVQINLFRAIYTTLIL